MTETIQPYSLTGTDYVTGGDTLLRWMGTLWSMFSDDPEFARQYQRAKGLIAAQLEVWYKETAALSDRKALPVLHRERWWPVVLTTAERNTGIAAAVQLGDEYVPCLGQQIDSPFILGTKLEIGGAYRLQGVTTYALPENVTDIATIITNDLSAPSVVLMRGIDFYVEDHTLFFLHNTDPLTSGKFPVMETKDGNQVLLWLCDMMVDRNYVQNFAGFVLGLMDLSSEFYKRYLNALWDVYNKGATGTEFKSGVAAMLDEPSVLDTTETVDQILVSADKQQVVTDAHVYQLTADAELRDEIVKGASLQRGELLTKSVRIYQNLDPSRFTAENGVDADIYTNVPALFLSSTFFAAQLKYGIGLTWERVPVLSAGEDANGNDKLWFEVYGHAADVSAFWNYFWQYCEANDTDPADYFTDYATVQPLEFFLANFLKANTLLVTVDSDKLSVQGRQGMQRLRLLDDVLPAHVYLHVLEHQTVDADDYEEYEDNALVADAAVATDKAGPGNLSKNRLVYEDRASVRWISYCQ